jgi:uncharacterized protein (DUF2062 family)
LSPARFAASVAVGLFVGSIPVFGVQLGLVLLVCIPFKLDAAIAYVAAHISNPLTLPIFVLAELEVGSLVLAGHTARLSVHAVKSLGLAAFGKELAVGALVVGAALALTGGATTWAFARIARARRDEKLVVARRRTLDRYQAVDRKIRGYVSGKLHFDPALESLAALEGTFGRLLDAGAGYGQLSLALLELGRATSVRGFDPDPARIAAAKSAAGDAEWFDVADFGNATFIESDTVLFVDCLHYADRTVQDAALKRAADALAPGGRIVVREINGAGSPRSRLTIALERLARFYRGESGSFCFRPAAELVRTLETLGLACAIVVENGWSLLDNVLIVARREAPTDQEAGALPIGKVTRKNAPPRG